MTNRFRVAAVGVATTALAAGLLAPLPAGAVPAVPQAPAHTSVAVGKLSPRGCTFGTGTAACELYAMTGTATMLGTTVPIWGFSPTGAAGSATAPGPALVVHQGDQVTVTLHNQLAGQTVSLAFPGQALPAGGEDTTGIDTGTRTYTFTADRPGTFVYEAGHTPGGARQVAMGLAGAFVVLPPDGTAYGTQPAGYPDTGYDDDALVVLSEVDPAFNANPTTFDLRDFTPKYRLINGKPYPASDPVATDQGHKVLLRYVNVGSQTHPMTVLGGLQNELAQGGHPAHFATTVASESIEPGQTLDAVVTMPTGPEAKLALYESARHLDNNGQHTADPAQFAFGGMLTFLDTNAPPPSTDGVGPVSTHLRLAPNPATGEVPVTVTADLSDATTGGSAVTQAEFVIDDAATVGPGFGTPMTLPAGGVSVTGATGTITTAMLAALDAGRHTVFVRALDAAGNWGVVGSVILNLPKTGPQTINGSVADVPANATVPVTVSATGDDSDAGGVITAAEYFLDTAGSNGTGTPLTLNRSATVVSEDADLAPALLQTLAEGTHHVLVHSKDSLGLWGPTLDIPLPIDITGPAVDAAAVGPNPTNGVLADKSHPGSLLVSAEITDKDAGGALQSLLVDAEAFVDPAVPNPRGGTGLQLLPVDGKLDSTGETFYGLIPLTQVKALADGTHHVYVRGEDAAGNWGPLFAVNLIVDKTAPVLGALTATPNPTNGADNLTLTAPVTDASLIAKAEYWLGTTDPGVGKGISVPVSVVAGKVQVTVPLASVPQGAQLFNLRVQDLAGNWSKPVSTSVSVQRPNRIFSDDFESGGFGFWSASTGGVANTTAAARPSTLEPGSLRGLQVTLPGAGYLTDSTPTAETSYHARFVFNRNTLTSGATALSLLQARTGANGQVFALEYRYSAGSAQVRTVFDRSAGGTVTGAWVTLATGNHTLQVDWTSGPATGASAGSLRLLVDGVSRSLQTGNTSTLRIETAWLGVSAGTSAASTGTAYFDTFNSTRYTMP
ncbi:multicopper oxidase domain-containing protein [Kribbella sp.]|uniref:multicopper oxidase domain-containing protein n=1 Tax=Kribbella sp. TaxID=1871183 RepID=UPI002D5EE5BF|nr:multicopper oxidase domain-containing protein [Kribbella sp.]HZX05551.1 multicopper oxidase domain-containing protein [Kribbella sp.]